MLVSPLSIDTVTITLSGKGSDSRTQTLTVTTRVTSRHTYRQTYTLSNNTYCHSINLIVIMCSMYSSRVGVNASPTVNKGLR